MNLLHRRAIATICISLTILTILTILTACGGGTATVVNLPVTNEQQTSQPAGGQNPTPTVPPNPTDDWTLAWSDEFDGASLNSAVWTADLGSGGWGNGESQYYKAQNAVVSGGLLTITAKREVAGDAPYTSARIQTSRKKSFLYGRFEMRAKLPATQGMWPAFWLLGSTCKSLWANYGGNADWPGCGEIDIMEMIGGSTGNASDYTTYGTLHYLKGNNYDPLSIGYRNATKLADGFHVYRMDWTPQSFTWYIDDIAYGTRLITSDMEEFHKPYFILLNLAVGGAWGGWANNTTVFPQTYVIDYVRHYTRPWPAKGNAAGLPSVWHLGADPKLSSATGTTTGAQPLVTLADTALSWYTPYLSGSFDAGAWAAQVWTLTPAASAQVRARIYRRRADGTETLLGEAQMDPTTTGSGNHSTRFNFTGIAAQTLSGETIRLELSKLSGPALTLVVNGNDFDSYLSMPWSTTGSTGSYPTQTAVPFPQPAPDSPPGGGPVTLPGTLGVYADIAYAGTWAGTSAPQVFAGGVAQEVQTDAFEGSHAISFSLGRDGAGWQILSDSQDLSAYSQLHFKIKTSSAAQFVRVRIAGVGNVGSVPLAPKLQASTGWQDVTIALAELGLAAQGAVIIPFSIEAVGGTPAFSALVDQIYFSKP